MSWDLGAAPADRDPSSRPTSAPSLGDAARDLEAELEWLAQTLDARLKAYFGQAPAPTSWPPPPDPNRGLSAFAAFLRRHSLPAEARLVLALAMVPHLRPQGLDVLFTRNEATGRGFTEFGGLQASQHGGFLPTAETALFLLAGDDLAARFVAQGWLDAEAWLVREQIVQVLPAGPGESWSAGQLVVSREWLETTIFGRPAATPLPGDFPARQIKTALSWPDLVLPQATLEQLEEIRNWVEHSARLLHDWQMIQRLRPGFTSLFHGQPGTGKTLAAALVGKYCQCPVYKIDLSLVVSKFIGETEKNLARVFDQAETKGWILFFDEADALFGKRTRVEDAHDRYANQEVSYLLQRVEDFAGVVILATNFKANIDEAFLRRFHSIIHFPMPRSAERLRLWREALPPQARLETGLQLERLAEQFELAGGTILNVVRYVALRALSRDDSVLLAADFEEGIRRELQKEGRAF